MEELRQYLGSAIVGLLADFRLRVDLFGINTNIVSGVSITRRNRILA